MSRLHSTVVITDKILATCRPTKRFDYHDKASITSLDFDDSGQYLISAGIDKSVQLYDVHKGTHSKDIKSQKYGAHLARFTHNALQYLHASTPTEKAEVDHAIRFSDLSNNQYLRYFKGHKGQVTSIEVNPLENTFLSTGYDHTVKMWDLKSSAPIGNLDIGMESVLAYDPQGLVFAVGCSSSGQISLYNTAYFDKGPFLRVNVPVTTSWNKLEFSNNGKLILVSTNGPLHFILDAFLGQILTTLDTNSDPIPYGYPSTGSCTFTPCGKFVLAGTSSGKVSLFDLNQIKSTDGDVHVVHDDTNPTRLTPFKVLNANGGIPKIVAFDPKLFTFATADNTVALWQPQDRL
ncbi:member of Set1p complex, histone methyl transferase [Suhomyces tanzawaensis NRRL Y-17324]|uniref:Member of Set1p complex, histone methyl transferase n=1 Tax=Suhomyces tanzawaensis NRRL Y-17324 TaxID=984487 RepID=A0A1E4SDN3_9ASCO|nr:member of Set1p complex, histone methyl transferase [Suhomyces tanzawaensis NRRL Y-17324]ODV77502.1 member of Set1p complex, histone methyl transferase [Suhomyces tanzawaensis NRRL Y-17324]